MSCEKKEKIIAGASTLAGGITQKASQRAVGLGRLAWIYSVPGQIAGARQRRSTPETQEARQERQEQWADRANNTLNALRLVDSYGGGNFTRGLATGMFQGLKVVQTMERAGVPLTPFIRLLNGGEKLARLKGNIQGDTSRTSLAATVVQQQQAFGYFRKQEAVNLWHSRMTPKLNRADLPNVGEKVLSSTGVVLKNEATGTSWHSGSLKVEMPDGQTRTMSHLQSLSIPSRHYYFDRKLSREELAGIVTGQGGRKLSRAEDMSGYIGQVGPVDSLTPGGKVKHTLLKNRVYYPPAGSSPSQPAPERLPHMRPLTAGDGRFVGRMGAARLRPRFEGAMRQVEQRNKLQGE